MTGWDARQGRNRWGRKCLSHPNWQRAEIIRRKVHNNDCANAVELGRKIALHHWRQLQEILPAQPALASMQTPAPAPAPQPEVQADFEMIAVPADKVDMAIGILKAAGIL